MLNNFLKYNLQLSYKGKLHMKKEKKKLKWWQKTLVITGFSIGGLIAFVLSVILTLNVAKFGIYAEYYSIRSLVCTNHGLNNNFVSQGTAVTDDGKYLITSGYMSDKTNSRIYITDIKTNKTHYVKLKNTSGKDSKAHFGGVAITGDTIYLSNSSKVYTLSLSEALTADTLQISQYLEVNSRSSFIFTNDDYLYVGEYYDGAEYATKNSYTYNGRTYHAIVEKYDFDDTSKPEAVYAIRNRVQGFAVDEKGGILLSTSSGINSSGYYYYKTSNIVDTEETYKETNAPLYVLETANKTIYGPAMSEDLDYYNGKFYTNFESSSNKYIFGKFFFNSNKIVALNFDKIVK